MRIDVHTHIIPEKIPDFSKKFGYEGFVTLANKNAESADMIVFGEKFRTINCNCWSGKSRLPDMELNKIDIQVLSPIPVMFCYWAKAKDALQVSRFLNDFIAQKCIDNHKKFVGLGTVPMQDTDLAITELERCREIGLKGVEIGTNINNQNLNHPDLHPFFEAAEELSMSIFVHPWQMMGMSDMNQYWLPWLVGMPAETSRAICSMIFGGIFEKFPRLRVTFAHGGGSFPYTLGRIERGFLERPDLCALDSKINPKDVIGNFYVDSLVHSSDALSFLIKTMGTNSIMLGSDYPFPLGEENPGYLIDSNKKISKLDKDKMFFKNAQKWLDI